uniref:Uncharacterized protein n=1 Tax=Nothoprocta perdicaria TaxID=30464 RepID=A0A8C6ZKB2_NOTPE
MFTDFVENRTQNFPLCVEKNKSNFKSTGNRTYSITELQVPNIQDPNTLIPIFSPKSQELNRFFMEEAIPSILETNHG